jgi:hypothetical protein
MDDKTFWFLTAIHRALGDYINDQEVPKDLKEAVPWKGSDHNLETKYGCAPKTKPEEAPPSPLDRVQEPQEDPEVEETPETPPKPARRTRKEGLARPADAQEAEFVETWNNTLHTKFCTPAINRWTEPRRKKLRARLAEVPDLIEQLKTCEVNDFARSNGFVTFDWLMSPSNLAKLLEGTYAPRVLRGRRAAQAPKMEYKQELESEFQALTGITIGGVDEPNYEGIPPGCEDPLRSMVDESSGCGT